MTIPLSDRMLEWIEGRARADGHGEASDYVCDLLRRERERHEALTELQTLVDEGLRSGPAEPFDLEAFIARKRDADAPRDL